jgi:hypothetical protein
MPPETVGPGTSLFRCITQPLNHANYDCMEMSLKEFTSWNVSMHSVTAGCNETLEHFTWVGRDSRNASRRVLALERCTNKSGNRV